MKPTTRELIGFMLTNDARTRTSSRDALTKKILKYVRREAPKYHWGFIGSVVGIIAVLMGLVALVILDEAGDIMVYLYLMLAVMLAGTPIIGFAGFRLFQFYFSKFPEDFPRG